MRTLRTRVRNLVTFARNDPGLILLASRSYVLLVLMRGVITVMPLRQIARHLGEPMSETSVDGPTRDQLRFARRVGWTIRRIARWTPTNSNCYPQALTARYLLQRRGIPSTVYYGAAFGDDEGLETHVWVRTGSLIVTGAPVHQRFAVVSSFADHAGWQRRVDRSVTVDHDG